MTAPSSERLLSQDPPSVRQIERLSAQLILFAQRHNKLKKVRPNANGEARYLIRPTTHFERPDVLSGAPFGYIFERKIGGLATHITKSEQKRLRITSSVNATELHDSRGGVTSTHIFNWDEEGLITAQRKIQITPGAESRDLYDLIDHFHLPEDEVSLLAAETEVELLTSGDVTLLANDVQNLIGEVDEGDRDYNEVRYPYMNYFAS